VEKVTVGEVFFDDLFCITPLMFHTHNHVSTIISITLPHNSSPPVTSVHIHHITWHHVRQLYSQSRLGRTSNLTSWLLLFLTTLPELETTKR